MRAFLPLIFLFSLSLSKREVFEKWADTLSENKLRPTYVSFNHQQNHDGQLFEFRIYPKALLGTYLSAHLEYNPDADIPAHRVQCEFRPSQRLHREMLQRAIKQEKTKLELERNAKLEGQDQEMKEKINNIDEKMERLQNWATRFDPKVRFSFNPDDNNGDISWVGATEYLFHGPNLVNLPKKGFGAIAMQEVMELYRQWMDPRYTGWVELRDQSEKYVDGAFWDELRAP